MSANKNPLKKTPDAGSVLTGGGIGGLVYTIVQTTVPPEYLPFAEAMCPAVGAAWASVWPWMSSEITIPIRRWAIEREVNRVDTRINEFSKRLEDEGDETIKTHIQETVAMLKLKYAERLRILAEL